MRPARSILSLASWAAILASGSGLWAAEQPVVATGKPRIDVPALTQDLGRVPRGQVAEARFAIGNQGDAVLNILEAKPG